MSEISIKTEKPDSGEEPPTSSAVAAKTLESQVVHTPSVPSSAVAEEEAANVVENVPQCSTPAERLNSNESLQKDLDKTQGNPHTKSTTSDMETEAPATLVATIKPEPGVSAINESEADESQVPDSFFDELLQSADDIGAAAMSPPPPPPPLQTQRQKGQNSCVEYSEPPTKRIKTEPAAETATVSSTSNEAEDIAPPPHPSAKASTAAAPPPPPLPRIKNEASEEGAASVEAGTSATDAAIPEHFFDDLLVDRLAQRNEHQQNEELEIKYADRLQVLREQLRQLDKSDAETNLSKSSHKKQKKSKKKSHKRSRSRSRRSRSRSRSAERSDKRSKPTPDDLEEGEAVDNDQAEEEERETTSANGQTRPLTVKAEFAQFGPSVYAERLECLPVQFAATEPTTTTATTMPDVTSGGSLAGFKRIKLERRQSKETKAPAPPPLDDEIELVITPKMKRDRAIKRAASLIKDFQRTQIDEIKSAAPPPLTRFHYTATVRKLPQSSSYVTQQIYENRSPLHTVNNVSYNFNSHATRFSLKEWGLEALPPATARVAKLLGCDAQTLSGKLQALRRLPTRLSKVKTEAGAAGGGECVDETRSSFFTNAMTQTDPVTVTAGRQRNGLDVGVQVTPHSGAIGTQTEMEDTESEASVTTTRKKGGAASNDDLPLMQLIKVLNENQLMALQDFAELISESGANGESANAMDMYRLRQRMLDIYKCAQLPSAMAKSATPTTVAAPVRVPVPKTSPIQITGVYSMPPIDPRTGAPISQKYVSNTQQPQLQPQQLHWQTQQAGGRPAYNRAPKIETQPQPPAHFQMHQQPQYAMPPRQHHHQQQQQQAAYTQRLQRQTAPDPNAAATAPKYYGRGGMRR